MEENIADRDEDNVDEVVAEDDEDFEGFENNDDGEIKKRSPWWAHYDEILVNGSRYAKCKHCLNKKYKVSGTSSSTGNMKRHMEKKHPDKLLQATLDEFVFSQETFRQTLVEWIVLCDLPFAVVEKPAFVKLIQSLNPVAQLISDKTVQADILAAYGVKMIELKNRLKNVPGKFSITMDGWTSKNVLAFVAIRAHWLDTDWKYQTTLLDFANVEGNHSGYKLKKFFEDCLTRFEIPFSKILGITVDNASNNDTFFFWLEEHGITPDINQIRCLAHILNLCVQDMLKCLKAPFVQEMNLEVQYDDEEDELDGEVLDDIDLNEEIIEFEDDDNVNVDIDNQVIVVKLRTLIKKIRKSVQMRQKLNKCCEMYQMKYLVPIIDVSTRWNSTYQMILRAEYLKRPLRALCSNKKTLTQFQIADSQWLQLHEIQTVLGKFQRATKLVSMERHSTICAYLPTLEWVTEILENCVADNSILSFAASEGLQKLGKYALDIKTSKIPFFAIILQPALKTNYFKEHDYSSSSVREIQKEFSSYFAREYENSLETIQLNEADTSEDEFYAHMFKRSKIEKKMSEFQKYLNSPLSAKNTDPIQFWKNQQNEFPFLSRMARDVLPIQSASVSGA